MKKFLLSLLARPEAVVAGSFAAIIVLGAFGLHADFSQTQDDVSFLDSLFTSTSATCVTGLTVVDTGTAFTRAGQTVVVWLIQIGGLGIMTLAALAFALLGARLSLRSNAAVQDSFFQSPAADRLRRTLSHIVLMTLAFEALGALALYPACRAQSGRDDAEFSAVFHSVSAFCNAGFSNYPTNGVAFRSEPWALVVLAALIVVGGVGYVVLLEVMARARSRLAGQLHSPLNWSLHSKLVVRASAALIVGGTLLIFAFGSGDDLADASLSERLLVDFFHSVSARTAGFNASDIGRLPLASLLVLIGLMFIGGSPGSCAGGIKTTSFFVWMAGLWAVLRGRREVTLWTRRLPPDLVQRTFLLMGIAVVFNMLGVLILSLTEKRGAFDLAQLAFEQVSAFGTVGLSTGITPKLSALGKLWLILVMYVGRVGPLTLALVVITQRQPAARYPEERVLIG